MLHAEARVGISGTGDVLDPIVARLRSFGAEVAVQKQALRTVAMFSYGFGRAQLDVRVRALNLAVEAEGQEGLSRLMELVATAVGLYARALNPQIVWTGDVPRDNRPAQFREMTVRQVRQLTPGVRRITLSGDNLDRFDTLQSLHVRMLFPRPGSAWPVAGANGLPEWPSPETKPDVRVYTIRAVDPAAGTLDVDMVLHDGDSIGSAWAQAAQPGDRIGILGPVGRPVRMADWVLLAADETGLPALARLLESLPEHVEGQAFVEVADAREEQPLPTRSKVKVQWLHRKGGVEVAGNALVDAVMAVDWVSRSSAFGWFAAEHDAARRIRTYWREDLGQSRDRTLVAGYWRRGTAAVMTG